MHKVTGKDAIGYMTSYEFYAVKPRIVEHSTGIDVDNAGRSYDHEKTVDYTSFMWSVLNHISFYGISDDEIWAEVEDRQNGNTTNVVLWFHIEDTMHDPESLGIHYEFIYES